MGVGVGLSLLMAVLFVWWRFDGDMKRATARAAQGSILIATRCGPIEYQERGAGIPLLMVHGSGGGPDQGMAFAGGLADHGVRVIAVSRFGYLRTPMPRDASPTAQADAHVCLLDALGIRQAAVLGGSAGGPSAMQMAIRHPDRVNALVLLVPLAWKPGSLVDAVAPLAPWVESLMMRLVGSDFIFWAVRHLAPDLLIRYLLATPPEQVAAASLPERTRIHAILDHILPVSVRAVGLRSDSVLGKSLARYPLELIRTPTLLISARGDSYGTYASAQYTASQIAGAKFLGFGDGGHIWVGHDDEVQLEIVKLLTSQPVGP